MEITEKRRADLSILRCYSEAAELLNKVTGWDFSAKELRRVEEGI